MRAGSVTRRRAWSMSVPAVVVLGELSYSVSTLLSIVS